MRRLGRWYRARPGPHPARVAIGLARFAAHGIRSSWQWPDPPGNLAHLGGCELPPLYSDAPVSGDGGVAAFRPAAGLPPGAIEAGCRPRALPNPIEGAGAICGLR